jgi:GNAT superfamily N-acetyltransferase
MVSSRSSGILLAIPSQQEYIFAPVESILPEAIIMPLLSAPRSIVRSANPSEFDAVIAVLHAANAEFAEVLPPAVYAAYLSNVLDIYSRLTVSELLVAEIEGRIAGTITLYPDASQEGWEWPAHWAGIRAIAVAPHARRHGLGRQLATAAIERARNLDAAAVCLHTAHFMRAAVPLYEHLGFRRCPAYDQDVSTLFSLKPVGEPMLAIGYYLPLKP